MYKLHAGIEIALGPGIGVVTHPVTRQWPGGPEGMPGSARSPGCYPVNDRVQPGHSETREKERY